MSPMNHSLITGVLFTGALVLGGALGVFFGGLQVSALAKNKKLRDAGKIRNGWLLMPGSFARVAVFLAILVIVQLFWPFMFAGDAKWLVSVGIILGYGWTLLRKIQNNSTGEVQN